MDGRVLLAVTLRPFHHPRRPLLVPIYRLHHPPAPPTSVSTRRLSSADVPPFPPPPPTSHDTPTNPSLAPTPLSDASRKAAESKRQRVRRWSESTSMLMHKRMNQFFTTASSSLETMGGKLNQLTGYDEIEELKDKVREQEDAILQLRGAARAAKRAFEDAVAERSACQREVNDLLQRKSSWTEPDVHRFTQLVRRDHLTQQAESSARSAAAAAEEAVERGQTELMSTILNRYHEEQVWSDKIRSASTYGSLVALGLNLVVFVLAIVLVEPWKRRRLAQTFEKRVGEMTRESQALIDGKMGELKERLETQDKVLSKLAGAFLPSGAEDVVADEPPALVEEPPPLAASEAMEAQDGLDETERSWKDRAIALWAKTQTKATENRELILVGAGGAAAGVVATSCLSLLVWSMKR